MSAVNLNSGHPLVCACARIRGAGREGRVKALGEVIAAELELGRPLAQRNEEAADEAVSQGVGFLPSASRSAAREVMSSFGKTR